MDDLARQLEAAADARFKLIATDGVFSMDGVIANLPAICDLAEQHGAMVMVDDSHAVGFIGDHGGGTPDYWGVGDRVDIITGHPRARRSAARPADTRPAAKSSWRGSGSAPGRTSSPTRWLR